MVHTRLLDHTLTSHARQVGGQQEATGEENINYDWYGANIESTECHASEI